MFQNVVLSPLGFKEIIEKNNWAALSSLQSELLLSDKNKTILLEYEQIAEEYPDNKNSIFFSSSSNGSYSGPH